jgi:hypothetical protein
MHQHWPPLGRGPPRNWIFEEKIEAVLAAKSNKSKKKNGRDFRRNWLFKRK